MTTVREKEPRTCSTGHPHACRHSPPAESQWTLPASVRNGKFQKRSFRAKRRQGNGHRGKKRAGPALTTGGARSTSACCLRTAAGWPDQDGTSATLCLSVPPVSTPHELISPVCLPGTSENRRRSSPSCAGSRAVRGFHRARHFGPKFVEGDDKRRRFVIRYIMCHACYHVSVIR